jgi:hypothetical protein
MSEPAPVVPASTPQADPAADRTPAPQEHAATQSTGWNPYEVWRTRVFAPLVRAQSGKNR